MAAFCALNVNGVIVNGADIVVTLRGLVDQRRRRHDRQRHPHHQRGRRQCRRLHHREFRRHGPNGRGIIIETGAANVRVT